MANEWTRDPRSVNVRGLTLPTVGIRHPVTGEQITTGTYPKQIAHGWVRRLQLTIDDPGFVGLANVVLINKTWRVPVIVTLASFSPSGRQASMCSCTAKVLLLSGLLAGLAGMFRYLRLSDGAPTPSLLPSSAGRACPNGWAGDQHLVGSVHLWDGHQWFDYRWRRAELEAGRRGHTGHHRSVSASFATHQWESSMTAPLYETRNVFASYGPGIALDDVRFALHTGAVVGPVGDNGAGKSTLVTILSGAHQPNNESLQLDGTQRHWKSLHDAIEDGIDTTDRVVVLRLGRVVRDAPTSELDADSLLATITGLLESSL